MPMSMYMLIANLNKSIVTQYYPDENLPIYEDYPLPKTYAFPLF